MGSRQVLAAVRSRYALVVRTRPNCMMTKPGLVLENRLYLVLTHGQRCEQSIPTCTNLWQMENISGEDRRADYPILFPLPRLLHNPPPTNLRIIILPITPLIAKHNDPDKRENPREQRIDSTSTILPKPPRTRNKLPRHPAIRQENAQLQHTGRQLSLATVVEVGQRVSKEPLLHLPVLRVVAVRDDERRGLFVGDAFEAVGDEARDGDVVARNQLYLAPAQEPVARAGVYVERLALQEVVV